MSGKSLTILTVPWDVDRRDTPNARGARGLLEHGFTDLLEEAGWEIHEEETGTTAGEKLEVVTAIGRWIAQAVEHTISKGRFPLILSGGCLASLGAVAGLQRAGREVAALWIDAHGDLNTPESSPSAYWDGMSLAALAGLSLPEVVDGIGLRPLGADRLAHLAGRAFDPPEENHFEKLDLFRVPPTGSPPRQPASGSGDSPKDGRSTCTWMWTESIPGTLPPWAFPSRTGPGSPTCALSGTTFHPPAR